MYVGGENIMGIAGLGLTGTGVVGTLLIGGIILNATNMPFGSFAIFSSIGLGIAIGFGGVASKFL